MKYQIGDIVNVTRPILGSGFQSGDVVVITSIEKGNHYGAAYIDKQTPFLNVYVDDSELEESFEIKVKKAAELYDEHEHGKIDGDTK